MLKAGAAWLLGCGGALLAQAQGLDPGALGRELRQQALSPGVVEPASPSAESPPTSEDSAPPQLTLRRVILSGVPPQLQESIQQHLAPWLDRSHSLRGLQGLADAVSAFLRERGMVAQAWLPPQTVDEEGVLTVMVLQARLGEVQVTEEQGRAALAPERARHILMARLAPGQALDTVAIERALQQLNALPGVRAQAGLEPGVQDGESKLVVNLEPRAPSRWSAELRNPSNRSSGSLQTSLAGAVDGPLRLGDQAQFFLASSEGMAYLQASYSAPWDLQGARWSLYGSQLAYRSIGEFASNGGRGSAWTWGASLGHPLQALPGRTLRISYALDLKGYDNRNLASGAEISRFELTTLSASVQGDGQAPGLGWGWSLQASVGEVRGNHPAQVAPGFVKLNFGAQRLQNLPGAAHSLLLSLNGQLADYNLSSSEQFFLGGPSGVRAYPGGQGAGTQGLLASAEWRRTLTPAWMGTVFIDAGWVQQYRHLYANWQGLTDASSDYTLAGWGVGARWQEGPWLATASLARRLGRNPLLTQKGERLDNDNTRRSPRLWVSLRHSF